MKNKNSGGFRNWRIGSNYSREFEFGVCFMDLVIEKPIHWAQGFYQKTGLHKVPCSPTPKRNASSMIKDVTCLVCKFEIEKMQREFRGLKR